MIRYHCTKNEDEGREMTLVFKRSEIIYDVSNYAYVEADVMPADDDHRRHQVADIAQDGNIDRVTRVLNAAHAECVEMLYPYAKEEIQDEKRLDDVLKEPDVYEIRMNVPRHFSLTTLKMLESMVHEYLVCRVLADWMSITNPAGEAKWERKYTMLRNKMRSSLVSRIAGMRRKMKPF
ncbi:MAG TPA: hypothetical protein IAA99_03790 [Candidatus Avibacteroides faecavium]|nr:hypothetical protein [Candidatus Avibacteroides faecavium]